MRINIKSENFVIGKYIYIEKFGKCVCDVIIWFYWFCYSVNVIIIMLYGKVM